MRPLYIICMAIRITVAVDLFAVAVFLGKNAATVFLHIEAECAGFGLAVAEANAKVAVEKLDPAHSGEFFADFDKLFVLLVG